MNKSNMTKADLQNLVNDLQESNKNLELEKSNFLAKIEVLKKDISKDKKEIAELKNKVENLLDENIKTENEKIEIEQKIKSLEQDLILTNSKLENLNIKSYKAIKQKENLTKDVKAKFKKGDKVFYISKYQRQPFNIVRVKGIDTLKNVCLYEISSNVSDLNILYVSEDLLEKITTIQQ